MKAYPVELRQRIVAAVDRRLGSLPTVAALFAVSTNCVANYLRLRADTGSLKPRPTSGGRPPAIPEERYDEVHRLVAEQPDISLEELRDRLHVDCSLAAVSRTLKKLGLGRKKKSQHAAEQQRPDVQQERDEWVEWQTQLTEADLGRLVFLDESWVITAMTPLYGRALSGCRVIEYVPQGHWERLTVMAAVRQSGVCGSLVFEGSATVEACEAFAEHCLGPHLQAGDIVILDNLTAHQHPDVVAALERRGVEVKPLPPYSPDFNPIEGLFSKVKQAVRRARARTTAALTEAVGAALNTVTREDIRGWFWYCGYHTDS